MSKSCTDESNEMNHKRKAFHTFGDILEKRLTVLRHSARANGKLQSRYDADDILALTRISFTPIKRVNENIEMHQMCLASRFDAYHAHPWCVPHQ